MILIKFLTAFVWDRSPRRYIYLKPILYDEYGGLKTHEIADLVKVRIQEKLDEVLKPAEAPVG